MQPLTASDCREIYYALCSKKQAIADGTYGESDADVNTPDWASQLEKIVTKIGPDGIHLRDCFAEATKSLPPVYETLLPELNETTNDVDLTKPAQQVVIRNIGDALTITVPDTLFLTLERIGGKTQLFVGETEGVDETCVVESQETENEADQREVRIKVRDLGGYLLTDNGHPAHNYGPVEWEPAKGPALAMDKIATPHLISILCMLTRIARFFGGRRWFRLLPMCYKALAEEAEKRGIAASRWLAAPASQPNWNGGIEKDLRHNYYVKAVVTGANPVEIHERLNRISDLVSQRVDKHESDVIRFAGIYPPEEEPRIEQATRDRVVQLGDT